MPFVKQGVVLEGRVCTVCGKNYIPYHIRQIRCLSCMYTPRYVKKSVMHKVKCVQCGREFDTNLYNKKFCSKQCRELFHYKPQSYEITCVVCGKKFMTGRSTQRFCTPKCRNTLNTFALSDEERELILKMRKAKLGQEED